MLRSRARWDFVTNKEKDFHENEDVLQELLAQRNLHTKEEIELFLSPNLNQLQSPGDLAMIDKAVERIHKAIQDKEKILIYGDYDADGVSSTALLLKVFKELDGICDYYIPNRFQEGYGLNKEAILHAKDLGVNIIITVDNGIASFQEVALAKELGIDVIITDHHDIQAELPDAYAIIHTELSAAYKFKPLAGVGIAFKLAEHLLGYFPKHLLDLVAIGTIADLVPLIGENRVLAYFGLKQLTNGENLGLSVLKQKCNIVGIVTEEDVGFRIGPRINAVGRLESADLAVQLLISEDINEIKEIVEEIEHLNQKRQQLVHKIVREAEDQLTNLGEREIIFLAKEDWHEGVLGIVASRLAKKYYRPTFILSLDQSTNTLKGSARSIPDFHLFNECMDVRTLFTSFGGHSQAAGMTLPLENKDDLIDHLNERLKQLPNESLQETIEISQSVRLENLSKKLIHEVYKLAPFGMDNPKPLFHLKDIPSEVTKIGKDQQHLKLQYNRNDERLEGIGFQLGHLGNEIAPQTPVSIVGELGINEWNGFETIQMIIQDIGIDEWQLFDHRGKRQVNLKTFINNKKECLFVSEGTNLYNDIGKIVTYEDALSELYTVKRLFLLDLPKRMENLRVLINTLKPEQIHVNFYLENSLYLQAFPTREEFKWLYAFIHKNQSFDIKEKIPKIMQYKKWSKDQVIFMLHVFNDLNFIVSDAGKIHLTANPDKRELHDSKVYQQRKEEVEIERVLYYSNYKQLKQLFTKWYSE